jgi:hypothetical protein
MGHRRPGGSSGHGAWEHGELAILLWFSGGGASCLDPRLQTELSWWPGETPV